MTFSILYERCKIYILFFIQNYLYFVVDALENRYNKILGLFLGQLNAALPQNYYFAAKTDEKNPYTSTCVDIL